MNLSVNKVRCILLNTFIALEGEVWISLQIELSQYKVAEEV